MSKIKDWFPASRILILIMARVWENILALKGVLWNIPADLLTEFHNLLMAAQAAFDAATPSERTPVLTARMNEAFDKLEACMRYIKDRYFKQPPLLDEDLVSLLLRPKDDTLTPIPCPESRPLIFISYTGYNTIVLNITVMPGESPPYECHIELFRGIMPQGGATLEEAAGPKRYLMRPPSSGDNLFKLVDTNRKREKISFPPEEGGKIAYFCARYVNEKGEAGPWGPVAAAVIPRADNPLGLGVPEKPPT